jgi:putative FmdB family regulatory protein
MPLYEYSCSRCGKTFEVIQKFVDEPLTVHEGCGGKVQRLLSPPALQFKGTGWYVTDYGRNGSSYASRDPKERAGSKSRATAEPASGSGAAPKTTPPASK